MKNLITAILLCTVCLAFSQERLTNIMSDESNSRCYVERVDEVNYLLHFDQEYKLEVSVLNADYSTEALHSHVIKGMSSSAKPRINGELLYSVDDVTAVMYNFVKDTEVRVSLPDEWVPRYWTKYNSEVGLLSASDLYGETNKLFLINNEGDILSDEGSLFTVDDIYGDFLLKRFSSGGNGSSYVLENIETGERDTIINGVTRKIINRTGDYLYYVNEFSQFYKFNLLTKEKSVIPGVVVQPNKIRDIKIVNDSAFFQQDASGGGFIVSMYNIETGSLLKDYEHEDLNIFGISKLYVTHGKIVVTTYYDIIIFNAITGEGKSYPTYYNDGLVPLLDDRYLLNQNASHTSYIDLKTDTESILQSDTYFTAWSNSNIVPMENSFLGVYRGGESFHKAFYKMDVVNKTLILLPMFNTTNRGMNEFDTEVLKFGEHIVLATTDIYGVSGSDVAKVNPHPIVEVERDPYRVNKDNVSYVTKDDNGYQYINSFDGNSNMVNAVIPKASSSTNEDLAISEYIITPNDVYFVHNASTEYKLMRYNNSNNLITELTTFVMPSYTKTLYQSENEIYFKNESDFFRIEDNGTLQSIKTSDNQNLLNSTIIENNGYCYHLNEEMVSIFKEDSLVSIVDGKYKFDRPYDYSPLSKSFILTLDEGSSRDEIIYVEGESFIEVKFDLNVSDISRTSNNHFFISTEKFQSKSIHVFNGNDRTLFDITSLNIKDNIIGLIFRSNEPHIITNSNVVNKAFITKLDSNFENPSLSYSTSTFGFFFPSNYQEFGEKAMLYLNDHISVIDEDFNVEDINVKGSGRMNELIMDDSGYVYFMGRDKILGFQLYRLDLLNFIIDTKDINEKANLGIYPNPSSTFITVNEKYLGDKFTIMDRQGRTVKKGVLTSNKVLVNELLFGLYYLTIDNKTTQISGSFIKN